MATAAPEKKCSIGRRGRPSKLTPEVMTRLVEALSVGMYIETAARAVELHPDTVFRWLRRGKVEKRGPFRRLFLAVKKALADVEFRLVTELQRGRPNWQSQAWLLERRFPQRWGRHRLFKTPPKRPEPPEESLEDVIAECHRAIEEDERWKRLYGPQTDEAESMLRSSTDSRERAGSCQQASVFERLDC